MQPAEPASLGCRRRGGRDREGHLVPVSPAAVSTSWTGRVAGSALAFVLGPLVFLTGLAAVGVSPFGSRSRSINDLGYQFEPLHASLWDLLHGRSVGGVWFNWSSALGVGFLPDHATYLSSPFALLVAMLPRDGIVTGLVAITALKYGAAGAAMTTYLRALRAGPWWGAGVLGGAYATCGWALDDASYVPMWIDGLIGLPLIALAGHWCLERRRPVLAPVVISLVWWANFYTAWMATLAAGLLVLAEALSRSEGAARVVAGLGRAVRSVMLGMALTSVQLLPTLLAVRQAQPAGVGAPFSRPPWSDLVVRLLPISEGVGATASVYVGTVVLVSALTLPFVADIPARTRASYIALLVLTVGSMLWGPTQLMWHGFDTPQGSPYRAAFAISGVLAVLAWLTAVQRPTRALLAGALCVAALAVAARGSVWMGPHALRWTALTLLLVIGLALAPHAMPAGWLRGSRVVLLLLIVLAFVGEEVATAVHVARARDARFAPILPTWGSPDRRLITLAEVASAPPTARTALVDPRTPNAALLYGYRGAGYYSSTIPAITATTLANLGHRFEGYGRRIWESDDPVIMAIEGVDHVLSRTAGSTVAVEAMPLVRLTSSSLAPGTDPAAAHSTPFAAQDAALGATVHSPPLAVSVDLGAGPTPLPRLPSGPASLGSTGAALHIRCTPGSDVQLWLPDQGGQLRANGQDWPLLARTQAVQTRPYARNGVISFPSGPDGDTLATISGSETLSLPDDPVSCVDRAELAATVHQARVHAPEVALDGPTVRASWSSTVTGTAVVAATAIDGWQCAVDGKDVASGSFSGLLAVPVQGAREVTCGFRQPGLGLGAACSAVAILALIVLALGPPHRWGRSMRRGSTARGRPENQGTPAATAR